MNNTKLFQLVRRILVVVCLGVFLVCHANSSVPYGYMDLSGLNEETNEQVMEAFVYMYQKYPAICGKVTSIKLEKVDSGAVAVTEYVEVDASDTALYPMIMEQNIVLNKEFFENDVRLQNMITKSVREGYWPKDSNVSSLIVHELGHVCVNTCRMHACGLDNPFYIDESNGEAFAAYNTDTLKDHQSYTKSILREVYNDYANAGGRETMETYFSDISGYAWMKQEDNGISYDETCAEAYADVYLHKEDAAEASIAIIKRLSEDL